MKILTVVGARPQFIKAGAVSALLRTRYEELLLHTGQHYDEALSARFFDELELPTPDVELHVGSGTHAAQTAQMLVGIESAIETYGPACVLVYGDTNSTLAGALAAAKRHVPVAHVEAGLRSFNRRMPEEINRVVADRLAHVLFCPSETARANLAREGIVDGVHVVGDVMAEAVSRFAPSPEDAAARARALGLEPGAFLVATVHRAENTDDHGRLAAIASALGDVNQPVAFPAHPRVTAALAAAGLTLAPNVRLMAPAGYAEMLGLVRASRAVLTDSGGLQKEAYWLGVPCVTLRDETEWVETVEAGWNRLTGADAPSIVRAVRDIVRPSARPPLYGEGRAVAAIVDILSAFR